MKNSQGDDVTVEATTGGETTTEVAETTGETDTSTTSSSSEQTDQTSEESSSTEGTEDVGGKFVPYERFREVNEKAKRVSELEAKLKEFEGKTVNTPQPGGNAPTGVEKEKIREAIKDLGFVPREDVQELLRQKDDDDALKQELTRLEGRYDGSDGRPKFEKNKVIKFALDRQIGDPEAAYKILNEKSLIDWQIKQALDKSKGVKTEVSTGTGAEVGVSNDDLKAAAAKGDKAALRTFLRRVTRT